MKFLNILLILFFISFFLCDENNNTNEEIINDFNSTENINESYQSEVMGELKKLREENNKKFKEKIKQYLKELKLENKASITKEEFKTIFFKLFEFGSQMVKIDEEKEDKKLNLPNNKEYINKIFNNLIKEEIKNIDVEKIIDYFEPNKMLFSLKDTLNIIVLDKAVESVKEQLLNDKKASEEQYKENEKNTDL